MLLSPDAHIVGRMHNGLLCVSVVSATCSTSVAPTGFHRLLQTYWRQAEESTVLKLCVDPSFEKWVSGPCCGTCAASREGLATGMKACIGWQASLHGGESAHRFSDRLGLKCDRSPQSSARVHHLFGVSSLTSTPMQPQGQLFVLGNVQIFCGCVINCHDRERDARMDVLRDCRFST